MICKKPNEPPYGFHPFSFSKRISKTFPISKFFKFMLFKDTQIVRFLWVILQIYFVTKHKTFVAFRFLETFDFRHSSILSVSIKFLTISHFRYKVRYKTIRLVWYYKSKISGIPFRAFIYTRRGCHLFAIHACDVNHTALRRLYVMFHHGCIQSSKLRGCCGFLTKKTYKK